MNSRLPEQLPLRFLNLNWDQEMDSAPVFDCALSSIVSSQASNSPAGAESLAFHKLIGGMNNVNDKAISPQSQYLGTPMSSPPKLNISMVGHLDQQPPTMAGIPPMLGSHMPLTRLDELAVDPGFAARAARHSSFDSRNYSQLVNEFGLQNCRVSRAGSIQSMDMSAVPGILQSEMSNGIEVSSVSDPNGGEFCLPGVAGNNPKKRKALPAKNKGKCQNSTSPPADNAKVAAEEAGSDAKRNRNENDSVKPKTEQNESGSRDGDQKPPEPPKDYIHVRARRGQATDSHSLAERVRREKISQRMKFLQDLVPGCNKVTGKAVMLDEIINYVQSLQRQVEFLSMKLATGLDFNNLASLFPKDIQESPNSIFHLETSGIASSYVNQAQQGTSLHCGADSSLNLLNQTFHQNLSTHEPFPNAFENAQSQLAHYWDDDLHSVVHMDMSQNQETAITSQSFNDS